MDKIQERKRMLKEKLSSNRFTRRGIYFHHPTTANVGATRGRRASLLHQMMMNQRRQSIGTATIISDNNDGAASSSALSIPDNASFSSLLLMSSHSEQNSGGKPIIVADQHQQPKKLKMIITSRPVSAATRCRPTSATGRNWKQEMIVERKQHQRL